MIASLPRPALYAIIGVVAVAGLFMFSRSRSASTGETATAPAAESTTPAPTGEQAGGATPAPAPATPAPATGAPAGDAAAGTAEQPTPAPDAAAGTAKVEGGPDGLPVPVAAALEAKKTLVLLFWNPRGVDDRSVKGAVDRLSTRGGKVVKFSDSPDNLARYTQITAAASVTQTPAIVIVDRTGKAEVQPGYIDFQTLDEYVDSALKR